ncbi:MAG: serine/threonine-protein kinase [Polyangiaceae bacterium]
MPRDALREIPFGPFVLERRLAVGGSADVYLARPAEGEAPASHLVVKRLLEAARQSDQLDLLAREAALHRSVRHPCVVEVFGAGIVGDEPYLAMEYVDGVDLYRFMRVAESENQRLPVALCVHIVRQVAAALQAVHEARDPKGNRLEIVHRDVTPSNIYLSVQGDVKLGDFGIARVAEHARAPSNQPGLKGKFAYLSPEQIAGEPFDHRADLFALAAVLGELLIGERVFPGSGQLAVLLAIRDLNIEPLLRRRDSLPAALFDVVLRALARDPEQRYPDASALSQALAEFEVPGADSQRHELAARVAFAKNSKELAERVQSKVRDSVQRMHAVRIRAGGSKHPSGSQPRAPQVASEHAWVIRAGRSEGEEVSFPRLLEMIATGELDGEDRVRLWDGEERYIEEVEELARHLPPSSTATTSQLLSPGAPDFQALLEDTPMLAVLARMREKRETGCLFVEESHDGGGSQRKELYLRTGRLIHVASSDRLELLGEYLIRRGQLRRDQLESALAVITRSRGRLGDTLITLGFVEAVNVFRAIRDQGRDRVAATCGWARGRVMFYRGPEPARVEFPLDLDLASPMMAGAIVVSGGDPRRLLPSEATALLVPGPRYERTGDAEELGNAPASLRQVLELAPQRQSVAGALAKVLAFSPGGRVISDKEASAALVAAKELGWVDFRP